VAACRSYAPPDIFERAVLRLRMRGGLLAAPAYLLRLSRLRRKTGKKMQKGSAPVFSKWLVGLFVWHENTAAAAIEFETLYSSCARQLVLFSEVDWKKTR
jgi:hypothetical protein